MVTGECAIGSVFVVCLIVGQDPCSLKKLAPVSDGAIDGTMPSIEKSFLTTCREEPFFRLTFEPATFNLVFEVFRVVPSFFFVLFFDFFVGNGGNTDLWLCFLFFLS